MTKRSTVLETKLRLEIDLYDLMSNGSREDFLILGRTTACLCESGNKPCVKEAYAMDVMIGASTSHSSLTSHVGIESKFTLFVRRFLQYLRYLLYSLIIEASE